MNVLPIPALDGGHALFILFEMITGRKPSDKFMEYAQITGMLIMFGLMFYALGLDFWRLFK
jgi:regulator of sigma E protease